ncbi:MAG: ABC transporter substrate-binding protein [Gammaproteobacteria bacterium]|nr:ABC transporter substrate-binding protein [Gammaproteobacteria bacterium]
MRDAAAGRHDRAARTWERLASTSTGPRRDAYLLDASRAWFNHGQAMKSLTVLRKVRGELPKNDVVIDMLLATESLVANNPTQALQRLDSIAPRVSDPYQPAYLELRARAHAMAGDAVKLIQALSARGALMSGDANISANHRLLWRSLRELSRKGHPLEAPVDANANVAGWLALANHYRNYRRNPVGLRQQLADWQLAYPEHHATVITRDLFGPGIDELDFPSKVALLLPLDGRFSSAGIAVRDGFLAAYMDDTDNARRPVLSIYDTTSRDATDVFKEAISDGAQFVVGPLVKSSVEKLVSDNANGAMILALNYLPGDLPAPSHLFQFSLAPEHEAAEAARRALAQDLTRAVALVPDTDWGARVLASFASEYERGGGILIDHQGYNPGEKDFRMPITQLLNLNSSRARHRRVSSLAGEELEFEPRRRQDTQLVFLAANADQGRLLRPQLNFHYANDLPVFATSAIFDNDTTRNRKDLDGIVFADAPWMISDDPLVIADRQLLTQYWPNRMKRSARLYAMGIDAYQLIPLLFAQRRPLETSWPGMTGVLSLEPGNRITRGLEAAQIKNGTLHYLPPLDEFDEPGMDPADSEPVVLQKSLQ